MLSSPWLSVGTAHGMFGQYPPMFVEMPHCILNASTANMKRIEVVVGQNGCPWPHGPIAPDMGSNGRAVTWEDELGRREFYRLWCDGRMMATADAIIIAMSKRATLSTVAASEYFDMTKVLGDPQNILNHTDWLIKEVDPGANYWAFICRSDMSGVVEHVIHAMNNAGQRCSKIEAQEDGLWWTERDSIIPHK